MRPFAQDNKRSLVGTSSFLCTSLRTKTIPLSDVATRGETPLTCYYYFDYDYYYMAHITLSAQSDAIVCSKQLLAVRRWLVLSYQQRSS